MMSLSFCQLFQRQAECFVRYAADVAFKFTVTHYAKLHKAVQNNHFVFAVNQRQRVAEAGIL